MASQRAKPGFGRNGERMEEMNRQMQEFVRFVQQEVANRVSHAHADASQGALIPIRNPAIPLSSRDKRNSR